MSVRITWDYKEVLLSIIAVMLMIFGTIYTSSIVGVSIDMVAMLLFIGIFFVMLGYVLPFAFKNPDVRARVESMKPLVFVLGVAITLMVYSYRVSTSGIVSTRQIITTLGESFLIAMLFVIIIVAFIGARMKSVKLVSRYDY